MSDATNGKDKQRTSQRAADYAPKEDLHVGCAVLGSKKTHEKLSSESSANESEKRVRNPAEINAGPNATGNCASAEPGCELNQ
jgi:hypothetical protein